MRALSLLLLPLLAITVQGLTGFERNNFFQRGNPGNPCSNNVSLMPYTFNNGMPRMTPGNNPVPLLKLESNGIPHHDAQMCNGITPESKRNRAMIPDRPPVTQVPSARYCVGLVVGYMYNGIPIRNGENVTVSTTGFDGQLRGVEDYRGEQRLAFDRCGGHGEKYHYHYATNCLGNTGDFLGVALDGVPIYRGQAPFPAVVDECNGAQDPSTGQYRYYAGNSFPFSVGCFRFPVQGSVECEDPMVPGQLCVCANAYGYGYGGGRGGYDSDSDDDDMDDMTPGQGQGQGFFQPLGFQGQQGQGRRRFDSDDDDVDMDGDMTPGQQGQFNQPGQRRGFQGQQGQQGQDRRQGGGRRRGKRHAGRRGGRGGRGGRRPVGPPRIVDAPFLSVLLTDVCENVNIVKDQAVTPQTPCGFELEDGDRDGRRGGRRGGFGHRDRNGDRDRNGGNNNPDTPVLVPAPVNVPVPVFPQQQQPSAGCPGNERAIRNGIAAVDDAMTDLGNQLERNPRAFAVIFAQWQRLNSERNRLMACLETPSLP